MPRRRKTPREIEESRRAEGAEPSEGSEPPPLEEVPEGPIPAPLPPAATMAPGPPSEHNRPPGPAEQPGGQVREGGGGGPSGRGRGGPSGMGRGRGRGRGHPQQYNNPNYGTPGPYRGPGNTQHQHPGAHQQAYVPKPAPYEQPSRPTQPLMVPSVQRPQANAPAPTYPRQSNVPPVQDVRVMPAPPARGGSGPSRNVVEQFGSLALTPVLSPAMDQGPPSPQAAGPLPVSSKAIKFPLRPGRGRTGQRCIVKANHFFADLPDKDLHQYDVCGNFFDFSVPGTLDLRPVRYFDILHDKSWTVRQREQFTCIVFTSN
jgi:eukaryotic translation initiation factor 2C